MGHSWSSRRRRNRLQHQHHNHLQSPPPPSYFPSPPPPQTLSPPPPSIYTFAANAPYPTPPPPAQSPYPALPPPSYSYPSNPYNSHYYGRPMMVQYNHTPYYPHQSNGWFGLRPPAALHQPPLPIVPYVDHQSAKKIKNEVNVHKDTIRVELDEKNPGRHLVSFVFDAEVDGSITIFYFGKEGDDCSFTPLYPEIYMPFRMSFQKGLGQKFCQPSGAGIDFGCFDMNDLSKPFPKEDVFPLVILAESGSPSQSMDERAKETLANTSSHAQITQAILEKDNEGRFKVRVIKQILWVDSVRYEIREIYGISTLDGATTNSNDSGKECVICMTEPKDTTVLPCRHMCMCSECAKELRLQSNSCPICRQPIQELLEIKINEG